MSLLKWAIRCYPRAWRDRYGPELETLVEDRGISSRDVANILAGALRMHLATASWGILSAFALAGILAAAVYAWHAPRYYLSEAAVRFAPAPGAVLSYGEQLAEVSRVQQEVNSRPVLMSVLEKQSLDLYPRLRQEAPMEDVLEQMRRDVEFHAERSGSGVALHIRYRGEDPARAQAAVYELTARAIDAHHSRQRLAAQLSDGILINPRDRTLLNFSRLTSATVLDPPLRPAHAAGPNAMMILGLGLLAGLASAGLLWSVRALPVAALTAGSLLLLYALLAYMLPLRYERTVILRADSPATLKLAPPLAESLVQVPEVTASVETGNEPETITIHLRARDWRSADRAVSLIAGRAMDAAEYVRRKRGAGAITPYIGPESHGEDELPYLPFFAPALWTGLALTGCGACFLLLRRARGSYTFSAIDWACKNSPR
jgi:hypothetical protein